MLETIKGQPERELPEPKSLAEGVWETINQIQRRGTEPEIRTGFKVLDDNTNGLHRKKLLTIAARPGIGKTSLACQLALNISSGGHKVVFVSLEMFFEDIIERMMCIEKGIDGMTLKRGGGKKKEVSVLMHEFGNEQKENTMKIIDDYCYKKEQLTILFEELGCDPDVIILDHLQHTRTDMRKSAHEALNDYLDEILRIVRKNDIALVMLSQINRTGDLTPSLAHLKGTGAIEEKSDYVLLMHDPQEEDGDGNNFILNLAKNRFGPSWSKYKCYFHKECTKFYESKDIYKLLTNDYGGVK